MALATAPPAGNVADALAYVREVRDRFARQTGKYREFLAAMRDFKTGTCVASVARRDATRPTRRTRERSDDATTTDDARRPGSRPRA